jgi:dTDP-4-dehydrorhamnose reductase
MKVLATGGDGQVGRALGRLGATALPRAALDITDAAAVARALHGFDAVVNAAAYTAVDRAESEPERAHAVNAEGAANVARAAAARGLPLVHLSTDYVFDGEKESPYLESDPVAPRSVYGATKAAGEAAVRELWPRAVILRTSWIFSADGHNFVKTILRLARERETLRVVADQRGGPTPADDVAAAALALLARGASGVMHLAGFPPTSWHGFATAIVDGARARGATLAVRSIEPIASEDYPTAAARPRYSVLGGERAAAFGVEPPDWRAGLDRVLDALLPVSRFPRSRL